ncbi:reverse transcriptase [Phytophthora megakarya]|uniref:Reverse transcriptase n=1 Tax=Phytophthora megakarya TaxID=4795 RepID=A0A225X1L8_9STRA|nr:reverse transcriptase [Phytophthora megakarya]
MYALLTDSDIRAVTQNVRGFSLKTRWGWMAAWRNVPRAERPALLLLQETHVTSQEERQTLMERWNWVWGLSVNGPALSHWSVGDQKTAGVGILVFSEYKEEAQPWKHHLWTTRTMAVKFQAMHILNIYAPSTKKLIREDFFKRLQLWDLSAGDNVIMGRDFNCVEDPVLDRTGQRLSSHTESEALTRFIQHLGLVDARLQLGLALDDLELSPHEHFTFWRGNSASRLDRFICRPLEAVGSNGSKFICHPDHLTMMK